jgi:hypothetical protein
LPREIVRKRNRKREKEIEKEPILKEPILFV